MLDYSCRKTHEVLLDVWYIMPSHVAAHIRFLLTVLMNDLMHKLKSILLKATNQSYRNF